MTKNGIPLKKSLFIFGSLVPDLLVTYIFNKHSQSKCFSRLKKLLKRICKASSSNSLIFSYYSGVATHYICDFLCYAHTPVFSGSLRDHLIYEKYQSFIDTEVLPFNMQDSMRYNLAEFISALEERILMRVRILSMNAELSFSDIPVAINIASWATSVAYLHCNNYPQPVQHINLYLREHEKTA